MNSEGKAMAYALIGLVIAATGTILLSNDIYIYPALSFYKGSYDSGYKYGTGWLFGLRKTFKHSALEYGASYMTFYAKEDQLGYSFEDEQWGVQLNYVQQLFYNKTPQWLRVYVGPTINFSERIGYGGIIGTEMKLFDRLKFDVRYELTSQTNQIQAGLILTYQKKYFWK